MRSSSPRKVSVRSQISGRIGSRRTVDEFALDKQIANRLRAGRTMRDLSQQTLAEKVGITFQQLQKYEAANNRVSASRLIRIANALRLPPAWFLPDTPGSAAQEGPGFPATLALSVRISRLPERERRIVMRVVTEFEK
jgi:transcriptional regulator with XRE-family HTH domain